MPTNAQIYTPSQVSAAYGFNAVTFSNTSIAANGAGQTIAIVEAFDDPAIVTDLRTFDTQFKLAAPPSLTKLNQVGGSALPQSNDGWARETALDVEWAHAIAPAADLVIIEAQSDHLGDLLTAVDTARHLTNVSVVTMSWGVNEFPAETTLDGLFTTPAGHINVSFVAASGDASLVKSLQYPSTSPNVVSVGGTTLQYRLSAAGHVDTVTLVENFWSGSVSGVSQYEPAPAYQGSSSTSGRVTPDVAYNANPRTGYAVYDSVPFQGSSGWQVLGGTSAAAPQWAALIAIANQGRQISGQPTLDGAADTLPAIYHFYNTAAVAQPFPTAKQLPHTLIGPGGVRLTNAVIAALVRQVSSAPASGSAALLPPSHELGKTPVAAIFDLPRIVVTHAARISGPIAFESQALAVANSTLSNLAMDSMTIAAGAGPHAFTSSGYLAAGLIHSGTEKLSFAAAVHRAANMARTVAASAVAAGGAPPTVAVRAIAGIIPTPPLSTSVFRIAHVDVTAFLSDSVSQFIEEAAGFDAGRLAVADSAPSRGHMRAWAVTAAVLAADAMVLGYALHRRSRRPKETLHNPRGACITPVWGGAEFAKSAKMSLPPVEPCNG